MHGKATPRRKSGTGDELNHQLDDDEDGGGKAAAAARSEALLQSRFVQRQADLQLEARLKSANAPSTATGPLTPDSVADSDARRYV